MPSTKKRKPHKPRRETKRPPLIAALPWGTQTDLAKAYKISHTRVGQLLSKPKEPGKLQHPVVLAAAKIAASLQALPDELAYLIAR